MRNLPIILCVLAVIGAVLSGALYIRIGNSKQILVAQLASAYNRANYLTTKLTTATEQNDSLVKHLTALDSDLGETKTRLTAAETKNVLLNREHAQTKAQIAVHAQNEGNLSGEIAKLNRELEEVRATSIPRDSVEGFKTPSPTSSAKSPARKMAPSPRPPKAHPPPFFATRSTEPITASVVSVGPSNAFVVLDCGSGNGATNGQLFAIQRGTETLATVLISDVRPNFSVAQVQPDSLHGALHKVDLAV